MAKIIFANWKLNPASLSAARKLMKALKPSFRATRATAVVCPPFPYLAPLAEEFSECLFGVQDIFSEESGPYTGAVSPGMVKNLGARFAIVGHSERRAVFAETDEMIARKVRATIAAGMAPVLCVGESLMVRRKGMAAARDFVNRQFRAAIKAVRGTSKIILAYEPIWSISTSGSGKKDTPEDAAEMIAFLKKMHRGPVIYGGSANAGNAAAFLAYRHIDGLLVGRASLDAKDFSAVLRAVQ